MVAYSFNKRFVPAIQAGKKRHTVRKPRKRHALPGEYIQLYTGQRTQHCRKILSPDPLCIAVQSIGIGFSDTGIEKIVINQTEVDPEEFAREDGFLSAIDMAKFWRKAHGPLTRWGGYIIRWDFSQRRSVPLIRKNQE